jgi:hypothetical protein
MSIFFILKQNKVLNIHTRVLMYVHTSSLTHVNRRTLTPISTNMHNILTKHHREIKRVCYMASTPASPAEKKAKTKGLVWEH